jgi:hypothetical protein
MLKMITLIKEGLTEGFANSTASLWNRVSNPAMIDRNDTVRLHDGGADRKKTSTNLHM